ncbi:MAG: hypothetical protein ACYTBJ_05365 [Planctomycetota bacterium]|jgi:hypothetical protein
MSLAALFEQMEFGDQEMAKEAEDQVKLAAEEDAAGRIMARGFMDELNKLAQKSPYAPRQQPTAGQKPIPHGPLKVPPPPKSQAPKGGMPSYKPGLLPPPKVK